MTTIFPFDLRPHDPDDPDEAYDRWCAEHMLAGQEAAERFDHAKYGADVPAWATRTEEQTGYCPICESSACSCDTEPF